MRMNSRIHAGWSAARFLWEWCAKSKAAGPGKH
jgi:hypothetical protein